jgi:peptidoglycan/LPS O-acetylase OafA/YrhL
VFTHPVAGLVVAAALITVQTMFGEITELLNDAGGSITGTCYVVLAALLVPSLVAGRGPLAWVLATRPLRFVGERSYSLYLIQIVVAVTLAGAIPQLAPHRTLTAVAVTIGGLLAADLLYRWVEVPMIDVGRRIIARRRAKAAPVAAVAEPALTAA